MKKEIYRTFTLNHKIILPSVTLKFLSENLLPFQIDKYISRVHSLNLRSLTVDQAKNILEELNKPNELIIKSCLISTEDDQTRFNLLKKRISLPLTNIDSLKENEQSYIFGIFHKGNQLEDDTGMIKMDFVNLRRGFLTEDYFYGFGGYLLDKTFVAENIFFETNNNLRPLDIEYRLYICRNLKYLKNYVASKSDILIGEDEKLKTIFKDKQTVIVSDLYTTIETKNSLIAILAENIFDKKEVGDFYCKKKVGTIFDEISYLEIFIETYLYQQIPFFEKMPQVFIVLNDNYDHTCVFHGIHFIAVKSCCEINGSDIYFGAET